MTKRSPSLSAFSFSTPFPGKWRPAGFLIGLLALLPIPPCEAQAASAAPGSAASNNDAANDSLVVLNPFSVNAKHDAGYGAEYSTGASRINMDNLDISSDVVTITQAFIDDLKPVEALDVLKYVSDVNGSANTLNSLSFALRGYETTANFRDGIGGQFNGFDGGSQYDLFGMDRIEVIQGPAGVLFGSTTGGGVINLVSKKPLSDPATWVRYTVGNDDLERVDIDSGGPIGTSGQFTYRAGLMAQNGSVFLGGPYDRHGVFGVLQWAPSPEASIWVRYEYQHDKAPITKSSWFMNQLSQVSTFINPYESGNESWEFNQYDTTSLEFGMAQHLSANLTQRLVARYDYQTGWIQAIIKGGVNFYGTNGALLGGLVATSTLPAVNFDDPQRFGSVQLTRQRRDDWGGTSLGSVNYDLTGDFNLGPTEHKAFVYSSVSNNRSNFNRDVWTYPTFDYLHPVYYTNPGPVSTGGHQSQATTTTTKGFNFGFQDNISIWSDRLVAAVGGRYDWADTTTVDPILLQNSDKDGNAWTFKYGLVGKITSNIAAYVQHSETFQFVPGVSILTGLPYRNIQGSSNEAGLKLDLFQGKLTSTLAVFSATLNNELITLNTLPSGVTPTDQSGADRTKGWDMDFTWLAADSITFLGGFSDLTSYDQNHRWVRSVPQGPTFKLFGKYTFHYGILKNFEIGAGDVFINKRAGDGGDTFTVPAYNTIDALANYRWKNLQFSLVVRNLLNRKYILTGGSEQRAQIGQFRTTQFSVTYHF